MPETEAGQRYTRPSRLTWNPGGSKSAATWRVPPSWRVTWRCFAPELREELRPLQAAKWIFRGVWG